MSTLIDVNDYFKGEDVPMEHPYQPSRKGDENLALKPNEQLSKEAEDTYGYKGQEHKNPHSGKDSQKVNNK